jgi:hypothetical protein
MATRSPILAELADTASPLATMYPTPSWPRICRVGPTLPDASAMSVPHTPVTDSLTSTSVGLSSGMLTSLISKVKESLERCVSR